MLEQDGKRNKISASARSLLSSGLEKGIPRIESVNPEVMNPVDSEEIVLGASDVSKRKNVDIPDIQEAEWSNKAEFGGLTLDLR